MSRPEVAPSTDDLYEALGPLTAPDEELGFPLLYYADSLCLAFVEPIAQYVSERGDYAPWGIALDPVNAPAEALAWLAQFVGATLEPALSEAEKRVKIALPGGWHRGTRDALLSDVKPTLTGTQTVLVDERYGASAWALRVRTYLSETPDQSRTLARILPHKPKGVLLTYEAITGQTWDDLVADHATWDDVVADYDTWDDVVSDLP